MRGRPSLLGICLGGLACSVGTDDSAGTFGSATASAGSFDSGPDPTGASTGGLDDGGSEGDGADGQETGVLDDTGDASATGDSADTTSGGDETTTGPVECGNGVQEGAEGCDGTDFGDGSCADFGFADGDLTCTAQCTTQTDGCYTCGDGELQGPEVCDGANFGLEDCESQGFGAGTLGCDSTCLSIDTAGCPPAPVCGNGMVEGTEQCDGADLDNQTCITQGYDGGTLGCNGSCLFDYASCTTDPGCAQAGEPCGNCCSGICLNGFCL